MSIVLAMHGSPPKDYPHSELLEFFKLHLALEHGSGFPQTMHQKHDEMEQRIRRWPRNAENDPFWDASNRLSEELSRITGKDVFLGFNEFCSPSVAEALENAVSSGANEVVVITPMMTPGGEHSENDIPHMIEQAQTRHPDVSFKYAWPFEISSVAEFLAEQLSTY
ncbi:MAG: sirohydrochlorin chelatase [Candidatus Thorarchaeota archaeon]